MDEPRAEKVAVVDEVRGRLGEAAATVVTEYRGLSVGDLAELRRSLGAAGGEYKIFKNTLVRRAVADSDHRGLEGFLVGPTGITFVRGDVSAVAKALRDFSRAHPALVVKGGLLDGAVLSATDLAALADLPSREVLLARMAGAIAAPMQQLAGLLQALPRNLAYGLSALLDQRGGAAASGAAGAGAAEADAEPEAAADAAPAVAGDEAAAATDAGAGVEEPAGEDG
jgi:large subunit ribosomal protein L10